MTRRTNNVRATERARMITAKKKASAKKKRIIVAVAALSLVLVAAGSAILGTVLSKANSTDKNVTKTVNTTAAAAPAQQQNATSAIAQAIDDNNTDNNYGGYTYTQNDNDTNDNGYQAPAAEQNTEQPQSEEKIEVVNGERIFIDTKRTAPEVTGTEAHYYANGKTSYGFDWTYDTDNSNFVLRCDYNFNQQQYDFGFYGVTPGTAHVTLYYNTSDKVQVPVQLTVTVDDNLNVTIN